MAGLRLVAVPFERQLERAAAQQAHAALGIADVAAGRQLEQPPAREIPDAASPGHRGEVAEAISDHELGRRAGGEELRDRRGGMLAVRVDREHGRGTGAPAEHRLETCSQGRALPSPCRHPHERRADLRRQRLELECEGLLRSVVDDRQSVDVGEHLGDESTSRNLVVARHERPHRRRPSHGQRPSLASSGARRETIPACARNARAASALP